MNATRIRTFAHKLGKSLDRGTKPASDDELLTRFLDSHDETAFQELIARHLPAVRAVCRSVLRDPNDVDDAAQATFLVFVRRASLVRNKLALGAWLCRIAWRTANRLREANARRASKHLPGIDPDTTPGRSASTGNSDATNAIEDEIRRLPEQYRVAVLTCYAADVSISDAAIRLGWPKGTLLTRLAWARKRLRNRLLKRGVTMSGSFTAVLAAHSSCNANGIVVSRIAAACMAAALGDPVARELISERVSTLTEGTVRAMIATKMKMTLGIVILVAALLGLGMGRMTFSAADASATDNRAAVANAAGNKSDPGIADGKNPRSQNESENTKADPAILAPGNDLVVRRPLGSYSRDIPGYGKITATFTENRIHVLANIRIEKMSFTVALDADYSMNRESMVYGIVTGADISGPIYEGGSQGLSEELAGIMSTANDIPFAFRIRVDDDSIMVK
ncbi:MAG TPA: RNA polymerase sigma factor, partial [Gemmata sp.]|nr:RNA polymerase sigma factor [Gemmata sp.]